MKKCLKFRNSARKLLVVINYFLADVHKYSSFIKALTIDFPIGDQTTSEKPMFFFQNRLFPRSKGFLCIFMTTFRGQGGIIQILDNRISRRGLLKTFRRQNIGLNMWKIAKKIS